MIQNQNFEKVSRQQQKWASLSKNKLTLEN